MERLRRTGGEQLGRAWLDIIVTSPKLIDRTGIFGSLPIRYERSRRLDVNSTAQYSGNCSRRCSSGRLRFEHGYYVEVR